MSDQVLISSRLFGKIAISVNIIGFLNSNVINKITPLVAKYTTKSGQINFITVMHVLGININNGIGNIVHWCVRFCPYHR